MLGRHLVADPYPLQLNTVRALATGRSSVKLNLAPPPSVLRRGEAVIAGFWLHPRRVRGRSTDL